MESKLLDDGILEYFRHDSFRPGQKEAILETQESFRAGKKYHISELPTGTGKSDIAHTLARAASGGLTYDWGLFQKMMGDAAVEMLDYGNPIEEERATPFTSNYPMFNRGIEKLPEEGIMNYLNRYKGDPQSYIVTSQKPLQDQYLRDFGYGEGMGHIFDIRGRNNYWCNQPKSKEEDNCYDNRNTCKMAGTIDCSYTWKRIMAQFHPIASTNSTFFAVGTSTWRTRELAVIDECHNAPDDVLNLVSFTIDDNTLADCDLPHLVYDTDLKYQEGLVKVLPEGGFIKWLETLKDPLVHHMNDLQGKARAINEGLLYDSAGNKIFELPKEDEQMIDKLVQINDRIQRFMENKDYTEWVIETIHKNGNRKFQARPLDSGYFAPGFFLNKAKFTALQSATIIDINKFCEDMGIRPEDMAFSQKPSPFPLQNRLVFNMDAVKMGYKDIEDSMDDLCRWIKRIVESYPVHKGIIHCQTYKLQKEIATRLRDMDRFIVPGPGQRSEAIAEHCRHKKPTVLMSPSMTEGIDLKGELARFSIVVKLPFPYLGDKRTAIKAKRDPAWYQYQTSKTLVQSVGRGVRSMDDWCHTYILDKAFGGFIRRAPLPPDFLNSVCSRTMGENLLNKVKQKYSR